MGFWHTGYFEFHELVGLEGEEENWNPEPVSLECAQCGQRFASEDERRKHRFEAHPIRRPRLFLDRQELGNQRLMITRRVMVEQVEFEGAERAVLNGHEIQLSKLGHEIAEISNDVCCIILSKDGVEAHFELEIRVASEVDLLGVEDQFKRMAACRRLDMRAVEEFINGAERFSSAIGYREGICAYLYGLLAKERSSDCSLSHEEYEKRYNKAAEALKPYDRKLAHIIGGLIEFHFNHFRDAARLRPNTRLGHVSGCFSKWIESKNKIYLNFMDEYDKDASDLESLLTEWDTEQVLGWACQPVKNHGKDIKDIEMFLKGDISEFDRVKLHILLGEIYAATGCTKLALEHAKALRNLPAVANWAEALIREIGEAT